MVDGRRVAVEAGLAHARSDVPQRNRLITGSSQKLIRERVERDGVDGIRVAAECVFAFAAIIGNLNERNASIDWHTTSDTYVLRSHNLQE